MFVRSSRRGWAEGRDRKSTRLNSSHVRNSYAVFCLKKKKRRVQPADELGKQQDHQPGSEQDLGAPVEVHAEPPALFFFNDTATTEIYTLSLHDALPICPGPSQRRLEPHQPRDHSGRLESGDRKSTRLNSSHVRSSYAVFCLKKKNG